jgi:hypothetical protein
MRYGAHCSRSIYHCGEVLPRHGAAKGTPCGELKYPALHAAHTEMQLIATEVRQLSYDPSSFMRKVAPT